MTEWEISVPSRTTLGKSIPKLHTRWRKILGSKLFRRVIPTNIKSIGRPPSKLPDKQNGSEGAINKKMSPYMNPIYRPPPKPPNMKMRRKRKRKYGTTDPLPSPLYIKCRWRNDRVP